MTKRKRLKRDPMNQRRGKVKAWAKKYGAIITPYSGNGKDLFLTRYLFLLGFEPGAKYPYHPNPRVARRAFRRPA